MVKALFVVTCLNELKIQPDGYFNPVLIRQVFTTDCVKLRRNMQNSVEVKMIKCKHEKKYINARFKILTAEQIFKI